jgi:surfeit locus 1 family protein
VSGRSRSTGIGLALAGAIVTLGFAALGTWQVERRAWKLDLIARVERRLAAAPAPAPGPERWSRIDRVGDEYARIEMAGRFLTGRDTRVSATTIDGPGYWLMTPFRDDRGFVVLVNRGFVPTRDAVPADRATRVTGLLRLGEPGGDLLRRNRPAADRWYSRDVGAIAASRRLGRVAPYFVDAAATPDRQAYPRGGLTVVAFPNNHLAYAATWYVLAAMTAGATLLSLRRR